MKTLFFVMAVSTLFISTYSLAAGEEILTCKDDSQDPNKWIYSLEEESDGNLFFRLKKEGQGSSKKYSAKFDQEIEKDKCIFKIVHEGALKGDQVTLDYRKVKGKYKVFIDMQDRYPIFQDVECKGASKELTEKLKNCTGEATKAKEAKEKETAELEQGMRCTSSPVDDREVHIVVRTDKEVERAQREVFSVTKKGTKSLGTAELSMRSRLDNEICILNFDEKSENKKNKMNMQVTIDKENRSQGKAHIKGGLEAFEGPINMRCELSGDLFKKLQKCELSNGEAKKEPKAKEAEPSAKGRIAI